jgi:hypothetical protein
MNISQAFHSIVHDNLNTQNEVQTLIDTKALEMMSFIFV